jgi:hypothetical protein
MNTLVDTGTVTSLRILCTHRIKLNNVTFSMCFNFVKLDVYSTGCVKVIHVFMCYLRSSVSGEHSMGPSISVCSIFQQIIGEHCCSCVNKGHRWTAMLVESPRMTLLQQWLSVPLLHFLPCWRENSWNGVENASEISVHAKEYAFATALVLSVIHCSWNSLDDRSL